MRYYEIESRSGGSHLGVFLAEDEGEAGALPRLRRRAAEAEESEDDRRERDDLRRLLCRALEVIEMTDETEQLVLEIERALGAP